MVEADLLTEAESSDGEEAEVLVEPLEPKVARRGSALSILIARTAFSTIALAQPLPLRAAFEHC